METKSFPFRLNQNAYSKIDPYKFLCRCLDKSQFFPPGRSIWCNNNRKGPTARPVAMIGGHSCCGNGDFCNKDLKPRVLDYHQNPAKEYIAGVKCHVLKSSFALKL